MRIALDYDETFTADREGWSLFVYMMLRRGHEIKFVTFRWHDYAAISMNEDIQADALKLGIPIIFTHGQQKAHCYKADVWIDDHPELIPKYDLALVSAFMETDDEQTPISQIGAAGSVGNNQGAGSS